MDKFRQKLHAQMGQIERTNIYSTRAHTLMEAATAICGYCAGTKGHDSHPAKRCDRWEHIFLVGNGANPCGAGPVWDLIEQCLIEMGAEVTATDAEIEMLARHGWEISDDQREARLYSEEWSSIQAAIASTRWWIEENRVK